MNPQDMEKLAALQKARRTPYGEVTVDRWLQSCSFSNAFRYEATVNVKWTLRDFAALAADKSFLRSPDIHFVCCGDSTNTWSQLPSATNEWSLAMMLKKDAAAKGDVRVTLTTRTETNALDVVYLGLVQLKVPLIDGADEQHQAAGPYGMFTSMSLDVPMSRCAQNDQLVVNITAIVCHAHDYGPHRHQIATLMKLFEQRAGDFVIRCGDEEDVQVFKSMLVDASPVFSAMLATDMREAKEGVLVVDDMTADTARALVKYLYVHRLTEEMDAAALLIAANKYDMEQLKDDCISQLPYLLSVDNALAMFRLIALHDATGCLKYEVLSHINNEQWSAADDVTEEDATALLVEANRYDMEHAKEQCIQRLLRALCADNAFAMFEVAELHNAAELKEAALRLIGVKLSSAVTNDDWKTAVLPALTEAFAKKM